MAQSLFKKHPKYQNFDEMFYCGMTRLRNTNFNVFIQCQYTRTILRNKIMGQSPFKKHSKFEIFDEILYCGMTKFTYFKKEKNGNLRNFRNFKNFN